MNLAHNSFIIVYLCRIDGANLVPRLCHQYEEKTLSLDGSYSGKFSRGRDHASVAQTGTHFAQ